MLRTSLSQRAPDVIFISHPWSPALLCFWLARLVWFGFFWAVKWFGLQKFQIQSEARPDAKAFPSASVGDAHARFIIRHTRSPLLWLRLGTTNTWWYWHRYVCIGATLKRGASHPDAKGYPLLLEVTQGAVTKRWYIKCYCPQVVFVKNRKLK